MAGGSQLASLTQLLASPRMAQGGAALLAEASKKATEEVSVGWGLPPIPRRLYDKMLSGEYVDLAELPPARVMPREPSLSAGNIWLVHSTELAKAQKKMVPDVGTWVQCFAIYASVVATQKPAQIPPMMAYMVDIIRASRQFKWPSWVLYDVSYRRQAAAAGQEDWSKVDPSLYARCFTGWARSTGYCEQCMTLEHDAVDCPYSHGSEPTPPKRPRREFANPSQPRERVGMATGIPGVCMKYNRYAGDCKFGARCKFLHVCQRCAQEGRQLPHPQSQCTRQAQGSGIEAPKPPTRVTAKPRE